MGAATDPVVWLSVGSASLRIAVARRDRLPRGVHALVPDATAFAHANDKAALLEFKQDAAVNVG